MTARDVGGIGCRMLALYVALTAISILPEGLTTLQSLSGLSGQFRSEALSLVLQSLTTFLLYGFAAVVLWVKSNSFWPNDNQTVSALTPRELQ